MKKKEIIKFLKVLIALNLGLFLGWLLCKFAEFIYGLLIK